MSDHDMAPGDTADIDGSAAEDGTIEWEVAYSAVVHTPHTLKQKIEKNWPASKIASDLIEKWTVMYGKNTAERGSDSTRVRFVNALGIYYRRVDKLPVTRSRRHLIRGVKIELG